MLTRERIDEISILPGFMTISPEERSELCRLAISGLELREIAEEMRLCLNQHIPPRSTDLKKFRDSVLARYREFTSSQKG